MKDELDYERDLTIDHNALDVEWLRQPVLFHRYSRAEADARREMDRAKEKLTVTEAELDSEIRRNPGKYFTDDVKVTNPAVEAVVKRSERYKDALNEYYDARRIYDILSGAVAAFKQRGDALTNLVMLYKSSYFSGPKEPRDLDEHTRKLFKSEVEDARKIEAKKRMLRRRQRDEEKGGDE